MMRAASHPSTAVASARISERPERKQAHDAGGAECARADPEAPGLDLHLGLRQLNLLARQFAALVGQVLDKLGNRALAVAVPVTAFHALSPFASASSAAYPCGRWKNTEPRGGTSAM